MSKIILVLSAIFAICQAASIVERIQTKCKMTDQECRKNFFMTVVREATEKGVPEMNIPPLDPYIIKNIEIIPLGLLKIILVDGKATGLKTCQLTKYMVTADMQRVNIDISCERLSVEGHYKIEKTPAFTSIFSTVDVHGDGKGKVILENVQASVDIGFEVKKHDDGQLYFEVQTDDNMYTYKIGKAELSADNIYIGKQEISGVLVNIFNENWEFFVKAVGNVVVDKILEQAYELAAKFYSKTPVSQITSDDLSSYVKS